MNLFQTALRDRPLRSKLNHCFTRAKVILSNVPTPNANSLFRKSTVRFFQASDQVLLTTKLIKN